MPMDYEPVNWITPGQHPILSDGDIHIWRATLNDSNWLSENRGNVLSTEERQRSLRFHFARDQERYVICRSILRLLLGQYLCKAPQEVYISYGPQGKPALTDSDETDGLRFNLSHSDDLALFAFARDRELGIDVEQMRSTDSVMEIALRFFSAKEQESLLLMPKPVQDRAFYWYWTRKEAYIKARGGGLSIALNSFTVSLEPQCTTLPITFRDEIGRCWQMQDISLGEDYAAALIVEGEGCTVHYWDWLAGHFG